MVLKYNQRESPYLSANFVSRLFFWWLTGFFRLGYERNLTLNDLYSTNPEDTSSSLGHLLSVEWKLERERAKSLNERERCSDCKKKKNLKIVRPSLFRAIKKVFLGRYILVGLIAFMEECVLKILQPLFLGYLIRYFTNPENYNIYYGYGMALSLCITAMLINLTHHPYFFSVTHIGMQVRIACCALLFRKATKLSQSSLQKTNIGQLVNLLSNDVNRLDISSIFIHYLWIGPITTIIITIILWQYYGPSCILGLVILILYVPFQGCIGKQFSVQRRATATRTDVRIRRMTEIISGIKVLKMFGWEKYYTKIVDAARKNELICIKKTSHLRALNLTLFVTSSKVIVFLTLLLFVLLGHQLTAELVFVTLALYNNVRLVMTLFFPNAIMFFAECKVSFSRLNDFLLLEERGDDDTSKNVQFDSIAPHGSTEENISGAFVKVHNVSAKWNPAEQSENTIENITLTVKPGQLLSIVGSVGSGKTSILNAILKELPINQGNIVVNGTVSYSSQEPWLFSGSVKENILFGNPFKKDWYEKVVESCALLHDFDLLPYRDNTLVGEKGNNLSGGQKARVTLARSIYADADIILLDDVLAAVDSHVGKHIFNSISTGILSKKTRILITHQLQYMKYVDSVVVLENGKISAQGTFDELVRQGINFDQMDESFKSSQANKILVQPLSSPITIPTRLRSSSVSSKGSKISTTNSPSRNGISLALLHVRKDSDNEVSSEKKKQYAQSNPFENADNMDEVPLDDDNNPIESKKVEIEDDDYAPVETEEIQTEGKVSAGLYVKYFRAGSSWCSFIVFMFMNIFCQILFSGSDYWLKIWTSSEEAKQKNETVHYNDSNPLYYIYNDRDVQIYGFSIICIVLLISSYLRNIQFFHMCLKSSVNLHRDMFNGIIHSPMSFFESTPSGRILNRFSKDMGQVDDELPICGFDSFVIFLNMLGIILLIVTVKPVLLIPACFFFTLIYYLRQFYMRTARSIKRLEGIARSPVFSHLSTSLYGLTTIRAFKTENEFVKLFDEKLDMHTSAWYLFLAGTRWFGVYLDWLCVLYIMIVTFSFMLSGNNDGAEVGLAVSSSILLCGMLQWGTRQSAELENQMVAVERIMEYSALKSEAPLETDTKPPTAWPTHGRIEFKNVSLQYDDESDNKVLENLSFIIEPCEKIGIVGRTGAGKSSLMSVLFRMYEPTGKILIDKVDVQKIGLHDLRTKISIIPQEPILFSGTIRKNLDPFENYSDDLIWNALEDAHLATYIRQLSGLDSMVSEGGMNFSCGQRQLLCLARAILFSNKILVMDEATANIDNTTDSWIQSTIQTKFKDCTVLSIAHRLNTVMDSDRIIVLDSGRIIEFDEPYKLLNNPNSALFRLVEQTGSAANDLITQAKVAHENRLSKAEHPENS